MFDTAKDAHILGNFFSLAFCFLMLNINSRFTKFCFSCQCDAYPFVVCELNYFADIQS